MFNTNNFCRLISILVLAVFLTSCGPSRSSVRDHNFSVDTSELRVDGSYKPAIVYIRPGAPPLEAYDRFIIDPVRVAYNDPKTKELSSDQVNRISKFMRDAVIKELRDAGYVVGTKSQPGTLRISFTLSGVKAPLAAANVSNALAPISLSVGEVTIEGVFRESVTDRVDAVAVNRSQGSPVLNPNPWSTWADVENSMSQWARDFRKSLDEAHKARG